DISTAIRRAVALVADALKDCSRRGGLVLDPFCGSGTILIAAERVGRKARALEIDPAYVDVAVRRWQALCVPKSSSVLYGRPNRLTSAEDACAVTLLPGPILIAIQVEEPT